jgi:hypothetical protein
MRPDTKSRKLYRLSPYEESIGPLQELMLEEDGLIACVGSINLILPLEMEQDLKPLLGQRISILRTDIPGKIYLVRKLQKIN